MFFMVHSNKASWPDSAGASHSCDISDAGKSHGKSRGKMLEVGDLTNNNGDIIYIYNII
jgi:hypothetical protein